MIIAVDGPVAAGKGTLARRLAACYGLAHLDTGLIYRAVARRLLAAGLSPEDTAAAVAAARSLSHAELGDPMLRDQAVGAAASQVAALAEVRRALLDWQRAFASHPPDGRPGAVLDGRDIGTVVCPAADAKLFVTASVAARAQRRWRELCARGEMVSEAAVLQDLEERDRRDSTRSAAPLRPARDAYLLDTSDLDIDSAFAAAKAHLEARLPELRGQSAGAGRHNAT